MSAVLPKPTSDWFTATTKRLEWIAEHLQNYEEDGDKAPTPEVIEAARQFLRQLNELSKANFEQPNVFVSPTGGLVLAYGGKQKPLNIYFTPDVYYCFLCPSGKEFSGSDANGALAVVIENFEV